MTLLKSPQFKGGLVLLVLMAAAGFWTDEPSRPEPAPPPDDGPGGCTVIMVAKGASTDGSTMTTHTCDCGTCDWTWRHVAAADHKPGATRKIYHISQYKTWPPSEGVKWDLYQKDLAGLEIPQVPHTYAVLLAKPRSSSEMRILMRLFLRSAACA